MQVVLVMFKGDQRRSFSVTRDVTVIGRREDCDLRIPLGDVSRKHCRLIKDDGVLRIEDLGSSNGTFINGERVQQAELGAGDTLQVGPVVFVAQVDGMPEEENLQPIVAAATAPAETNGEAQGSAAGLSPTAQSDAGEDGEFDPMEALNADGSVSDFNIEEALGEVTGEGGDNTGAAVGMEDSEIDALDEVPLDEAPREEAPVEDVPLEDAPVDLEDAEHDQKA